MKSENHHNLLKIWSFCLYMKKFRIFVLASFSLFLINWTIHAQNSTDILHVTGKVKAEKFFSLSDFKKLPTHDLGEINTSCSPKKRETAKGVKAILLKNLLDSVRFQYDSPKMLQRFYFRFEGADGYTVVYSFNEIFNTETGNHLFLVTEMNGQDISQMENRILLLTTSDIKPGSRNIKSLARIVVCIAE